MAALFPKGSDAVLRFALGLLLAGAAILPLSFLVWVRTPYARGLDEPVEQPVEFDHRHHVVDDGIDCRYCHTSVDRAPPAGMPGAARCMGCHVQVFRGSPALAAVRSSVMDGRPIRWVRVHRLPDFVFFDHGAHTRAGVGCETCHGRVDRMARVRQVEPLTMTWCLDCHRDPAPRLRPPEEATAMGWTPQEGGEETREGRLGRELDVRPGTDWSARSSFRPCPFRVTRTVRCP